MRKENKMVITEDDIKIRKKAPPPARQHKNPKAYRRRPKHAKRDIDPGSGSSNGRAASF